MDAIEKFDCLSRFILLQVPYEVPARRGPSQLQDFFLGFLDSILTEVCDARPKSLPQHLSWVCLADCN
jgi:hypothetical protein